MCAGASSILGLARTLHLKTKDDFFMSSWVDVGIRSGSCGSCYVKGGEGIDSAMLSKQRPAAVEDARRRRPPQGRRQGRRSKSNKNALNENTYI